MELIKSTKLKEIQHNYSSQINTLIALTGLCVILSILTNSFLTIDNLLSVCLQATMVAILAVAETFVIITGGIDLAVGATVALSSAFMGQFVVSYHLNPYLGILVAIAIGILAGLTHGILITKLNLAPFIVTLGTMTIWRGIALQFVNGQNIYGLPDVINWLGQAKVGPVPVAIIITIIIYFAGWFILKRTKLGMYTYAIGGNKNAARLSGININKTTIYIYTLGGLLCAISGILVAGRMNGTSALVANGYELDAIAAAYIGGISAAGGEGNIWGTLIGAIIMQVIRNGMNLLNISPYYQMVVIGAVIILAVGVDGLRRKGK